MTILERVIKARELLDGGLAAMDRRGAYLLADVAPAVESAMADARMHLLFVQAGLSPAPLITKREKVQEVDRDA